MGAMGDAERRPNGSSGADGGRRGLGLALAVALAVRLGGLFWGLPDDSQRWSFHPDEYRLVDAAARVVAEPTLHPTRFQYGSLAVYLPALAGAPFAWAGLLESPRGWHLVGRLVSLVAALGTVWATWALARRLVGPSAAGVAALALALAPGHALLSTWATPDAPATLCVTLALAATAAAIDADGRRATRALLLAGLAAGLAAGVKYSAGAVALAPVAAALFAVRAPDVATRLARGSGAGALSLVVFAAVTPHAFLSTDEFLKDLEYELVTHPRHGHGNLFEATGDGWSHHLVANLPYLLGWPLAVAGLVGLVPLARRGGRGGRVTVGFALLLFAALGTSQVRFMRYLLPLAPILCVAAGAALAGGARPRAPWRRLAVAMLLGYTALLAALQLAALADSDPRECALAHLEAELPNGALIGTTVVPTFFHPPFVAENGGPRIKPRFDAGVAAGETPFRFAKPTRLDAAALGRAPLDAFVLSEFDWREELRLGEPGAERFAAALDRRFGEPTRFVGLGPTARRLFGLGLAPAPHDWLYPFQEVLVWKRRSLTDP